MYKIFGKAGSLYLRYLLPRTTPRSEIFSAQCCVRIPFHLSKRQTVFRLLK